METRKIFAEKFNEAMNYSNLSYAELAKKLKITKATMSMYKHGKALPSLETFDKICEFLDISADFLLGKKDL